MTLGNWTRLSWATTLYSPMPPATRGSPTACLRHSTWRRGERNQSRGGDMGREFERHGVIRDLSTSVRIIDWAYR
jgi:hypothetical protein